MRRFTPAALAVLAALAVAPAAQASTSFCDPVTGTAHGVAAIYLHGEGLLPPGERVVLVGEQGHAVDRRVDWL